MGALVAMMGFLAAGFFDQAPLLHAGVVTLPFDSGIGWTFKYAAHRFTAGHDGQLEYWTERQSRGAPTVF